MISKHALENLKIPSAYKKFIEVFLQNIESDQRVKKIILFGSCAREEASLDSDIDILVTTVEDLGETTELEFYHYLPDVFCKYYVPCDLIVMPDARYEEHKYTSGFLQKYVNMEGIDLHELL